MKILNWNNETTNSELIQKIKTHLLVDEKELLKLKKETLLILLEYLEMTQEKDRKELKNKGFCTSLSIVINNATNTNTINLTGYEDSKKVVKTIDLLTEEQVEILSKHINKKIARATETYFEFVTTTEELTIESFIENLAKEQEIKNNAHEIDELMVLTNE